MEQRRGGSQVATPRNVRRVPGTKTPSFNKARGETKSHSCMVSPTAGFSGPGGQKNVTKCVRLKRIPDREEMSRHELHGGHPSTEQEGKKDPASFQTRHPQAQARKGSIQLHVAHHLADGANPPPPPHYPSHSYE